MLLKIFFFIQIVISTKTTCPFPEDRKQAILDEKCYSFASLPCCFTEEYFFNEEMKKLNLSAVKSCCFYYANVGVSKCCDELSTHERVNIILECLWLVIKLTFLIFLTITIIAMIARPWINVIKE